MCYSSNENVTQMQESGGPACADRRDSCLPCAACEPGGERSSAWPAPPPPLTELLPARGCSLSDQVRTLRLGLSPRRACGSGASDAQAPCTRDRGQDTAASLPASGAPGAPGGQPSFTAESCARSWGSANVCGVAGRALQRSGLCPRSEARSVGGCPKDPCGGMWVLPFVCKEDAALYLLRLPSPPPAHPHPQSPPGVVAGQLKTQACP